MKAVPGVTSFSTRSVSQTDNTSIILMIGDGMGPEQVNLARLVEVGIGGSLTIDELTQINNITTFSANNIITDSAAAATAISTGIKTKNGFVGMDNCTRQLETILEAAQSLNKSTGLVTTTEITHATPAAFATHVVTRTNMTGIASQLTDAGVDVLLGGNQDVFTPEQINAFQSSGYNVAYNLTAMETASGDKLLGLFSTGHLPYVFDRNTVVHPSLPQMTQKTLDILSKDPDGFFVMIEGGRIDHASHANDPLNAALETIEFDQAVKVAKQYVESHPNTLLIVTADHETGGFAITGSDLNNTLPTAGMTRDQNMSLRSARVDNISVTWTTTDHTSSNVPLYGIGVSGPQPADNTDIYTLMRAYYSLSGDPNSDIASEPCPVAPPADITGTGITFSTFLGGSGKDDEYAMALDENHNIYIAGWTDSSDFPTTLGAYKTSKSTATRDIFVTKFSADGSSLVYSTFVMGTEDGFSNGGLVQLALDSSNNAVIGFSTSLDSFGTTPGALNSTINGDRDVILAKISADGSNLVYGTYLGGSGGDSISGLIIDSEDNIYFTGQTDSSDFPTTSNAYQRDHNGGLDVYITKLSANGSTLEFSTLYGGSGHDNFPLLARDSNQNLWISSSTTSSNLPVTPDAIRSSLIGGNGWSFGGYLSAVDLYLAKFSADGSQLLYSSYLGGSKSEYVGGIVLDSYDNLIISGSTGSNDFPITSDAFDDSYNGGNLDPDFAGDIFVTKITSDGSEILYSTFFGGSDYYEFIRDMTIDSQDRIYLTGWTGSADFPLHASALDSVHDGIASYSGDGGEAFLSVLSTDSEQQLVYSTFIGGQGGDEGFSVMVDDLNNIYIAGRTSSSDFPTTANVVDETLSGNNDIFITKIDLFSTSTTTTTTATTTTTTTSQVNVTSLLTFEILMGALFFMMIVKKRKKQR
jgi:alkaline phosphatase